MNELVKKYMEMYDAMAASADPSKMRIFGEAEKWAFRKVAEKDPAMAEKWLDRLEPSRWNNFLSRDEANDIVADLESADGVKGPQWNYETFKNAIETIGGKMAEEPYYNCYALWATANMLYSDHKASAMAYVPRDMHVKFFYAQAVEKLKDADRLHFVREYFGI